MIKLLTALSICAILLIGCNGPEEKSSTTLTFKVYYQERPTIDTIIAKDVYGGGNWLYLGDLRTETKFGSITIASGVARYELINNN